MGFLDGLRQFGEFFGEQDGGADAAEFGEIGNFLQFPLDIPDEETPDDRRSLVIRVAMQVDDPQAEQLAIRGIREISLAEYPGMDPEHTKVKYLYRNPVGANVSWSFSPLYKLGKGEAGSALEQLTGSTDPDSGKEWPEKNKCRYYKLYHRVIKGFEEAGTFTPGSSDVLMNALVDRASELAEKWVDKKRSYLLVFGAAGCQGEFLYPGDLVAFRNYITNKLKPAASPDEKSSQPEPISCSVCHETTKTFETLDKVLKFSTFDKVGFLPGLDRKNDRNVFPICHQCFALLSRGKTEVEDRFSVSVGIPKVEILVIPEMIGGYQRPGKLAGQARDFLRAVEREEGLLEDIQKRGGSFVYHFLFIETSQAQIIIHRLVEDIPPTQFKKIKYLWADTRQRFFPKEERVPGLDQAVRMIMAMVLSLAGKTEGDKQVMKDKGLTILASLFGNEWIDVQALKQAAVERLPGLFSNDEWINGPFSGGARLEQLLASFEFLSAANAWINREEADII